MYRPDMATDLAATLASMAIGALITYAVNVRSRRRSRIEDLFDEAIAAVAVAGASVTYTSSIGRPEYLSDSDFEELQRWLVLEGIKSWATRLAEANQAVAKVVPFDTSLSDLVPFGLDVSRADSHAIIERLTRARARTVSRG